MKKIQKLLGFIALSTLVTSVHAKSINTSRFANGFDTATGVVGGGSLALAGSFSAMGVTYTFAKPGAGGMDMGPLVGIIFLGFSQVFALSGSVSGGFDFYLSITDNLSGLSENEKEMAIAKYDQINSLSRSFERSNLLSGETEVVANSIKCSDCNLKSANHLYLQMVSIGRKYALSTAGQDVKRSSDSEVKEFFVSNGLDQSIVDQNYQTMISSIAAIEVLKINN